MNKRTLRGLRFATGLLLAGLLTCVACQRSEEPGQEPGSPSSPPSHQQQMGEQQRGPQSVPGTSR
jgi:hypothetical protein